jgi:hypothetical protein
VSGLDPNVIGPVRILVIPSLEASVPQLQAVCRIIERTDESAANARLIAAAPDMLVALQDTLGLLFKLAVYFDDGFERRAIHDQLTRNSAAIAKAEGAQ